MRFMGGGGGDNCDGAGPLTVPRRCDATGKSNNMSGEVDFVGCGDARSANRTGCASAHGMRSSLFIRWRGAASKRCISIVACADAALAPALIEAGDAEAADGRGF